MKPLTRAILLSAATLVFPVSQSQASVIDFTGSSATSGTAGNVRSFSADGISLTAYAQSYTSGSWSNSYLGIYSGGLGVTNRNEGKKGDAHTVDNSSSVDRVVFSFSTAVILDLVGLSAFGDTDITAYYYSGGSWNTLETNFGGSSNRTADINAAQISASIWAVGAIYAGNDKYSDSFKIGRLTFGRPVAPPPPPAPTPVPDSGGSFLLLAIGSGCLFLAKNRLSVLSKS